MYMYAYNMHILHDTHIFPTLKYCHVLGDTRPSPLLWKSTRLPATLFTPSSPSCSPNISPTLCLPVSLLSYYHTLTSLPLLSSPFLSLPPPVFPLFLPPRSPSPLFPHTLTWIILMVTFRGRGSWQRKNLANATSKWRMAITSFE